MSERLALVFHSPRVGRSVLGARAVAVVGAASRIGDLAHCKEHRTTRQNDDRRTPEISAERHVGRARERQACRRSGGLSYAANRRRSYQCQALFWGSGVKTADTTIMSHSNGEGMLLRSHASW